MNRFLLIVLLCTVSKAYAQLLNEICPSNVAVFESEDESYPDWFEVYNNTASSVDLADFYFSNDRNDPTKWSPSTTIIAADDYGVLFAKDNPDADDEIFPYSFRSGGGHLYLANGAGTIIDSIVYPKLLPDHSYGRFGARFFYFETATPEANNETEFGFKGYAHTPSVNYESGRYDPGTNVVIRPINESETVYYSTNGTNPLGANLYETPIVLTDITSLRAVAIGDSLIASAPVFKTYFVDVNHQLPVVNLNLDSLELLDEIIGIYVLGPDAEEDFPYYGANFWKDIEIHAYYEYFDLDMVKQDALDCGVKIHGGTVSSTRPMKSLRLIAHDRYETEEFNHLYFKDKSVSRFKRLLLRNSGSDYNKTHLKDGVLHNFVLEHKLDVDVQGYSPVVVYINGIYWGIHNLREKLDKYYPASNYGVDPETVNLLEEEELILIAGDSAEFIELRDYVAENDLQVDAHYQWVSERLDLNSLVDYFIMELYVNNRDWPNNNLKLWNSPEYPKWRYFYSDLDAGMSYYGTEQIDFHSLEYILGPQLVGNVHVRIFKKLLTNNEFRRYFINRYADLMNTILEANYMLDYIYAAKEKINDEMLRHFYKWYDYQEDWGEYFLDYDAFFSDRVDIVRNELSLVFDKPDPLDVYVGIYPSGAGEIQLNSLALDSFPFVGMYYPENLIDLSVMPKSESTFMYWENLRTGEKQESLSIQVNPSESDSLIAVFRESEELYQLKIFPNPVVDIAEFNFSLPTSTEVDLELYSVNGNRIALANYPYLAKGSYAKRFDFSKLKSGNYIIMLVTPEGREGLKFIKI